MSFLVDLAQPFGGDVGVDLGGGKIFVAEHFLDAAQIAAPIQKMRCETVSKRMWTNSPMKTGAQRTIMDKIMNGTRCQTSILQIGEKRPGFYFSVGTSAHIFGSAL